MLGDIQAKRVVAREKSLSGFIPYSVQLDASTLRTKQKDLVRIFKLQGVSHESADDRDLNAWAMQLNILLRNLSSPNVALWTHTVRRVRNDYPGGDYAPGFARAFNEKYRASLQGARMYVNDLYLTVVYRPQPIKAFKLADWLANTINPPSADVIRGQVEDQLHILDDITQQVKSSLAPYVIRLLSTYEHNGHVFSEPLEFLAYLINGFEQRMPLPRAPIDEVIGTSRPYFGTEAIELRGAETSKVCAVLGIKEYPSWTEAGFVNDLLTAPFEYVLSQSFVFMSKQATVGRVSRQQARMINSGDLAESQIAGLDDALDGLVSNLYVGGDHCLSLRVIAGDMKTLADHIGNARAMLADCGMVIAREDVALEAAFWSELPCNFDYRARTGLITSMDFAGFASFHNYPTGKAENNHWGPAVALLKTASGAPFYFNFHVNDLGNTTIIGPSGTGKTVLQGFCVAQLEKFKPNVVFFDKDRGAEIFIRAQHGYYMPLRLGAPTGFNPFQRDLTPDYEHFLQGLLRVLVAPKNESYTAVDEQALANAIRGVYGLPQHLRRVSQVLSFLDPTDPDGIRARLNKWCHGQRLGWVFDNEEDNLDFTKHRLYGFDITEFLDDPETRTPIILYLFRRMEQLITGERFVCFIDEFWKAVGDPAFQDFVKNKLKTIRKQNGFLITGTQSPSDTLQSPIARSIIEQSPTQIFMPNAKADHEEYVGGFKLTEREFEIVISLPDQSRRFLVKQGQHSVIAELNLKGFDQELAVLSGTTANINLVNRIITEVGNDPAVWLPIFFDRRVAA